MKKSKIIVPALAMIAFSAAASIAGSVAWFTASRQATVNAGTYAVVKTNANLKCEAVSGVGTAATNSGDTHTIAVDTNHSVLTDGSFNHTTSKIYTPNEDGNGFAASPRDEIALINEPTTANLDATDSSSYISKLIRGTTSDTTPSTIYTAVTFNLEFTVGFGSVAGDLGLYLDCTQSDAENPASAASKFVVDGGAAAVTATGFRMAIVGYAKESSDTTDSTATNSAYRSIVFADLQTAANCTHVASTSTAFPTAAAGGTAYSGDLIDSSYKAALPDSTATLSQATTRPDYLGKFAHIAGAEVTLKYTVVCWYEGTDPNIINQTSPDKYQSVISTLSFKTVTLPTA